MRLHFLIILITLLVFVCKTEQQFVRNDGTINNNHMNVNHQFQDAEKFNDPYAVRASTTPAPTAATTPSGSFFGRVKNFFSRNSTPNPADVPSTTASPNSRTTSNVRGSSVTSQPTPPPRTSTSQSSIATQSTPTTPRPAATPQSSSRPSVAPQSSSIPSAAPLPSVPPTASSPSFASILKGSTNQPSNIPSVQTTTRPVTHPSTTQTSNGNRVAFVPQSPYTRPSIQGNPAVKTEEDREIVAFTEELFRKESSPNSLATFNYQGRTQSFSITDEASGPMITIDKQSILSHPTLSKLYALFDNYELDVLTNEYESPAEKVEQTEFIDAISRTAVMQHTKTFLQTKGKISQDQESLKKLLKEIWFTLYSRGGGKLGSSSFEHIFLSEVKNSTVVGLHNWLYFAEKEKSKIVDYKGYLKKFEFDNKGGIAKVRFSFNNINKPVNTMFIGTSPELEMALYTVCFMLRVDKDCPISLGGKTANIRTYPFRYRGKMLIGSAYPEI